MNKGNQTNIIQLMRDAFFGGLLVFAVAGLAQAADDSSTKQHDVIPALAFIQKISASLEIELLKGRSENLLANDDYLDALIQQHILPYVDINYMAKKVGNKYWSRILEQGLEQEMEAAITAALKRTYRIALASYSGEKIEITHSKEYSNYSLVRVLVSAENQAHTLDFAVRAKGEIWQVFDISVDGVVFSRTLQKSLERQFESNTVTSVIQALKGEG